jgi:hypothetical protein
MNQSESQPQKTKNKLYIFTLQSDDGTIQRIFTGDNYDQLWLTSVTESKAIGGFWSAHDLQGRFINGNFRAKVVR